jgi:hypothetical protein
MLLKIIRPECASGKFESSRFSGGDHNTILLRATRSAIDFTYAVECYREYYCVIFNRYGRARVCVSESVCEMSPRYGLFRFSKLSRRAAVHVLSPRRTAYAVPRNQYLPDGRNAPRRRSV